MDLDFESYLENSVIVIEWGAKFISSLSDQYLEVIITSGDDENSRQVEIKTVGKRWQGFLI